ncbi:MAG: hydroxymethylbilane synthase [Anaerolineales bacterium]|nr:hydroxymethylbilane synthase [Anaerolineales bacterium]
MKLIFATRPSALARQQTQWVIRQLQELWPNLQCEERVIQTHGDRVVDRPLPAIGGKGLFTQELEAAILSGDVDAAVHSLKDLPTEENTRLIIGCIPRREDPRDVLISSRFKKLSELPAGAILGTSSLRRSAQALRIQPELTIKSLRGNVDTRLRKAMQDEYDAIILAGAGLVRLGLQNQVVEWLSFDQMLPAPGQGALAVQCRANDQKALELLARLEHRPTRLATTAERAFLAGIGAGCSVPVAAYAEVNDELGTIQLRGRVIAEDGARMIQVQAQGTDAQNLGSHLAEMALEQGAVELLASQKPS